MAGTYAPNPAIGIADPTAESYRRRGIRSVNDVAFSTEFKGMEGWFIKSANATATSGYFTSTVGVVFASIPCSDVNSCRASAIIKCTKLTPGSYTKMGLSVGTPGTLPSIEVAFGVAYIQGTGLVVFFDTLPNTSILRVTLLADASMTDGVEYMVSFDHERDLFGGTLTARVQNLDGSKVTGSPTPNAFDLPAGTYPSNNFFIQTNATTGTLRALRFGRNRFARLPEPACPTWAYSEDGLTVGQKLSIRIPAQPMSPPAIVFFLGGATSLGQDINTDASQMLICEILERSGFVVVSHDQHTGEFGNDSALADMQYVFTKIGSLYGCAPRVSIFCISMGGILASRAAAGQANFQVDAIYAIDALFDLANPVVATEVAAAWPAGYVGKNPVAIPLANYGSTKWYSAASPDDVTVPKVSNTDVMKTKLGSLMTVEVTAGGHNDASHFTSYYEAAVFFRDSMSS